MILEEGEVFGPDAELNWDEVYNVPKGREPMHSEKFMLLETPYVKYLRYVVSSCLDKVYCVHV